MDLQEVSRIVTALGAVAASTGLIIYGIGASYWQPGAMEVTLGLWMMILGTIVTIVGAVIYRRTWLEED
jgi:ABC-type phosphate transport system permease subunit